MAQMVGVDRRFGAEIQRGYAVVRSADRPGKIDFSVQADAFGQGQFDLRGDRLGQCLAIQPALRALKAAGGGA